jgi:hypothetical protein
MAGVEEALTPQEQILKLERSLFETTQKLEDSTKELDEKKQQCQELKQTIVRGRENHDDELNILQQELEAAKEEAAHSKVLWTEKNNRLKQDTAHIQDVETENIKLRDRIGLLMNELEKRGSVFAEESHRIKNDAFNLRTQLESTFRKTLHEMDAKYKDEAFNALGEDSKNALIENSKLEKELTIQSIGIEALLKRYNNQLEMHRELKVENEILVKKDKKQSKEVRDLKQDRLAAEARVASLQDSMNQLNSVQIQVAKLETELGLVKKELVKTRQSRDRATEKAKKWKDRAFEMSQQMLEQSSSRVLASQGSGELGGKNSNKNFSVPEDLGASPLGDSRAIWNSNFSDASPSRSSPGPIPGLPMVASVNLHENMGPGETGIVQSRFRNQKGSRYTQSMAALGMTKQHSTSVRTGMGHVGQVRAMRRSASDKNARHNFS